jgi:hypothetical protein
VGKLYLPPGGRYYGCRHCYDLTYTSCQESHKYDGMWRALAAQCSAEAADMRVFEAEVREERRIERAANRREQLRRRRRSGKNGTGCHTDPSPSGWD